MKSVKKITFVTSNQYKINTFILLSAQKLQDLFEINFQSIPDLPEIQGTCEEVAIDKAIKAYNFLKCPVFVDDESWLIEGLNGFPGPYLKDFEKTLKAEGLYRVIKGLGNEVSYPQVHYAFTFDGKNVYTFNGTMKCNLISPRVGREKKEDYWEILEGEPWGKRLAEITEDEENNEGNFRKIAIDKLISFLIKNYDSIV